MQTAKSINQLLAEKGIKTRCADGHYKALYRDGEFLGFFRASTAVERFLPEYLA